MSDDSTRAMIEEYMDEATARMFFSSFFQSPPRNFHKSEKVEFDVLRDDEDVAIVVQDLSVGARKNEATRYTNKEFTPPIYKEEGVVTAWTMNKRAPGRHPFEDLDFVDRAVEEMFRIARKLEMKIRRAIELQASQVLTNGGILQLIDQNGVALYNLDFQAKNTHFPTVSVAWGAANATPLRDIANLGNTVRADGRKKPKKLAFGEAALYYFLGDPEVQKRLDNRSFLLGRVEPEERGDGVFHGEVWIGQYKYEIWSYDGTYKHPQTGAVTSYLATDKVVLLPDNPRFDLTFGAIPKLVEPDPRVREFLPDRMSSSELGLDMSVTAYFSPNGEVLNIEIGTRALCIPTAIDTYGCLDVTP